MTNHVNTICKSVNIHIRNIWRIRRFLTRDACHHVVRGLVLSNLDYMRTSFLMVRARLILLVCNVCRTKANKAARLVMACGRDQSSIDLLRELHWLPVRQRIAFKLLLYVYKAINNLAPSYLSSMTHLQNTGSAERRPQLPSCSDSTWLVVQRSHKGPVTCLSRSLLHVFGIIFQSAFGKLSPCLRSSGY